MSNEDTIKPDAWRYEWRVKGFGYDFVLAVALEKPRSDYDDIEYRNLTPLYARNPT